MINLRHSHLDHREASDSSTSSSPPLGQGRSLFRNQKAGHTPGPSRIYMCPMNSLPKHMANRSCMGKSKVLESD